MSGIIGPKQDLEQDLDNFSRVLDMDLDLRLDLIEFTGRLIGFPLVNRFIWDCFFLQFIYLFVWNPLGQRGSVGMGFGRMAFVAYGGLQPTSVKGARHQAGGL
jgi:hypothetical protein